MRKNEKFWDRVSGGAGSNIGPVAAMTIENAGKYLTASDRIIDLGCGPGTMTVKIAGQVREVLALDISSGMLGKASSHAAERGVGNVEFRQATIFDGTLPEGPYDAVLAFNVLHYVEDPGQVFRRIRELLKPGGMFISATACVRERMSFLRMLTSIATGLGLIPKMHYFRLDELTGTMEREGFEVVETKRLTRLPDCLVVARKPFGND